MSLCGANRPTVIHEEPFFWLAPHTPPKNSLGSQRPLSARYSLRKTEPFRTRHSVRALLCGANRETRRPSIAPFRPCRSIAHARANRAATRTSLPRQRRPTHAPPTRASAYSRVFICTREKICGIFAKRRKSIEPLLTRGGSFSESSRPEKNGIRVLLAFFFPPRHHLRCLPLPSAARAHQTHTVDTSHQKKIHFCKNRQWRCTFL